MKQKRDILFVHPALPIKLAFSEIASFFNIIFYCSLELCAVCQKGTACKNLAVFYPFFSLLQENPHLAEFYYPQQFNNSYYTHMLLFYVFIYEAIKWLTDWLFNNNYWLIDCLTDCLTHYQLLLSRLIGPNLQLSITWPILSQKSWICAALKYFILKEHNTILKVGQPILRL